MISSFVRVISRGSFDSILAWFITQRNKNKILVKGWLEVSQEPENDSTDAVRDRRQTRARPMLVRVNLYSWQLYLPGTKVSKHKPENFLGNLHVKCRFFF